MTEINYNSAAALRAFLEAEGLGMRKKFGQNFLINPAVRQSLVEALEMDSYRRPHAKAQRREGAKEEEDNEVWEIGPGLGAMTALLLEKGLKVKAFEIDPGFIGILKKIFEDEKKFCLVEGDVMKTWSAQEAAPFLLGNLPYNIGASLLAAFIEKGRLFTRMVVTVQREVALRMAALAGSPDYSSFSLLCSSVYKVKPLMVIRPSSFYPQPNVDSMGVLLENKNCTPYPSVYYSLVRSLFASRRKTVKNNLTSFIASRFGNNLHAGTGAQELCLSLLRENGLTGGERAEALEAEVFLSLAKSVENVRL